MTVLGALILAGCNNNTATPAAVTGIPSIGIAVPLRTIACTSSDSCIALGTTGAQLVPTSVGEYRQSAGGWAALNVPAAASSVITSVSCWKTGCLVGGVQPSGSLVWGYNASSESVGVRNAPARSQGVRALSCFANSSCGAVVSVGSTGMSAILFTSDAGSTWSLASIMPWSLNETIKGLSCTDSLTCMVSAQSSAGTLDLEVTHDGGVTWTSRVTPSSWVTLTSLQCSHRKCVALATSASSSKIARTSTFGREWKTISLPVKANALACATMSTCVIGGKASSASPWLATMSGTALSVKSLRYVPSSILDVACGTKICTALGVSTLMALHP